MGLRLLMTTDAVGGVWTYATDLAAGLAVHGVETTLAVLGPAPTSQQLRAIAQVPKARAFATGQPLDWLSDASGTRTAARELAQLARRTEADLVHLNSPALAAAADWPVPVIGAAHGCLAAWWKAVRPGTSLPPDMAWHAGLMAEGLSACSRTIAPTAAFAQALAAIYNLDGEPRAVHNGRSWPVAPQPSAPAPFAMTAGRLWDEAKNTPVLDRVASLIKVPLEAAGPQQGPQGQLALVSHMVARGNLGPAALGARLRERPVFVSAARFEPFGLAVLEAAASGCALVLADIPTFRELWQGAAQFVPCNDTTGFAAAIDRLIANPAERLAWGERARRRAARYSVARMASAMMTEYRAALRSMPAPISAVPTGVAA